MVPDIEIRIQGLIEFNKWVKRVYKEPRIKYTFAEFENLPELYMDIICLHFVDHMTFKEIGEMYGFSKSNAQSKLYQAYRRLNRGDFK